MASKNGPEKLFPDFNKYDNQNCNIFKSHRAVQSYILKNPFNACIWMQKFSETIHHLQKVERISHVWKRIFLVGINVSGKKSLQ